MSRIPNISLLFLLVILGSCTTSKQWIFQEEILLNNIKPIGIAYDGHNLWLSDVINNRIVKTNLQAKILEEFNGFSRPMHISAFKSKIYVPEYTSDTIKIISEKGILTMDLNYKPDAPAGISKNEKSVAIADFYNHRIILQTDNNSMIFGTEGHITGQLYYPTDVELHNNLIYVADAYNNRVQVFDKQGNSIQIIGENDNINVATGINISGKMLYVTDFESNRILIYNIKGELTQILTDNLNKPTDVLIINDKLYVVNYGSNSITVYNRK